MATRVRLVAVGLGLDRAAPEDRRGGLPAHANQQPLLLRRSPMRSPDRSQGAYALLWMEFIPVPAAHLL